MKYKMKNRVEILKFDNIFCLLSLLSSFFYLFSRKIQIKLLEYEYNRHNSFKYVFF